jgi:hypothetical protein
MAQPTGEERRGLTVTRLVDALRMRPRCDSAEARDLSPEQQAAFHAFLYDVLRAYHHLKTQVPEDKVLAVLNGRFREAAESSGDAV